jgi:hypothetical protein
MMRFKNGLTVVMRNMGGQKSREKFLTSLLTNDDSILSFISLSE